jgi:enamine deaminase RidA (YjgF/YER057c/UK114 family)
MKKHYLNPTRFYTHAVSVEGAGKVIYVSGQVSWDAAGKVVGKGDMRAQIEQVGKNVGACLKAAGATVNDIASTISFVATPAEFDRHADLLPRYFGPPSPESLTIRSPHLSSPDVLLEVEAVAAIK